MDRVQKRLAEIKRKQLQMHESIQAARSKAFSKDKSHLVTALMGIAAGVTIAVIALITNSLLKDAGTSVWDLPSVILGKENSKTDERIDQLNDRVELLADSVSRLEMRFDQFTALSGTSAVVTEKASPARMDISEDHSDNTVKLDTSSTTDSQQETVIAFVPTHTVNTRLNLRPSISLDKAPIALLDAGTKVKYIDEEDGWYYVDTALHGKGWCASEFLSPLQESQ